jgi:hypothetical protein
MKQEKTTDLSDIRQDRQCMYNVTLRSGSITTFAIEKHYVLHTLGVSVFLSHLSGMQSSIASRFIVLRGLPDCTKYFRITP